jgi:pimeloyl-ACP methyl ester carboxylesterase
MVGYGQSIRAGRQRDIGIARQAAYLLAWLEALDIGPVVFAGHDLGGGVAQIAAVRAPARCAGLFLTNAVCFDAWPIPIARLLRTMGPLVERLPEAVLQEMFRMFFTMTHDRRDAAAEALEIHFLPYRRQGGAAAFLHQLRSLDEDDTLAIGDRLDALTMPARVVWGAADPFLKLPYGERLARALRAPLRSIEGAGHFTPEDHPAIVAEELDQLLRDVPLFADRQVVGSHRTSSANEN